MRPTFFLSSFACLCFKSLFSLLNGYTKQGWAHLWKVPGSLGKGRLCAARTNSFGSEEVGDWAAQTEEYELESPRGNLSCWAECFPMFCFRCYLPLGLNYVGWFLFFLKWQCFAPCSPRKIPCSALALQYHYLAMKGRYIYIFFLVWGGVCIYQLLWEGKYRLFFKQFVRPSVSCIAESEPLHRTLLLQGLEVKST